jgi:hypothetical protein
VSPAGEKIKFEVLTGLRRSRQHSGDLENWKKDWQQGLRWPRLSYLGWLKSKGGGVVTGCPRSSKVVSAHPSGSQNFASKVPMTLAGLRVGMKARHSAWQAGVISSPFHMAAMRMPLVVQPGHRPKEAQYRRGHSKGR